MLLHNYGHCIIHCCAVYNEIYSIRGYQRISTDIADVGGHPDYGGSLVITKVVHYYYESVDLYNKSRSADIDG